MDELEARIAALLARRAAQKSLTTYPQLAEAVAWYNSTGQGLGRPLAGVLDFCEQNGFPILTSIVCATGTSSPSQRGVAAMRDALGRQLDISAEQKAVFAFNWTDTGIWPHQETKLRDFGDIYATTVSDYTQSDTAIQESLSACYAIFENTARKLLLMLHVGRAPNKNESGPLSGRLLGIMEVTRTSQPEQLPSGSDHLLISRAWHFLTPPLARSCLVDSWSAIEKSCGALVPLSTREVAEITQHEIVDINVQGELKRLPVFTPPEPAIHTYMAVSRYHSSSMAAWRSPYNILVKIGVSNNKERRLLELNGNHIAVIFGVSFTKYSEGTWPTQNQALQVERRAHEWCHTNGKHASGEYFFLREDQLHVVGSIVFRG